MRPKLTDEDFRTFEGASELRQLEQQTKREHPATEVVRANTVMVLRRRGFGLTERELIRLSGKG